MASITATDAVLAAPAADRMKPVRIWLYAIAAMVLMMVIVGGTTRLTGSGLSITHWNLISGVVPPLDHAAWVAEFDNYKQIPQYRIDNPGMTLDQFKSIFWWEWGHRLLGRLIGFVFFVPFLIFLVQRRFSRQLAWPLFGIFCLGALQGLVGWWMVSSGLEKLTSVSQYRLAAHLTTALILFLALIFFARRLQPAEGRLQSKSATTATWPLAVLMGLIMVQIFAGALVAGLHAGFVYNTWPLMDGGIVPSGLGTLTPLWRNFFENVVTVQFQHRMIAYVVFALTAFLLWRQAGRGGFKGVDRWMPRIGILVLIQVGLGIATLVSVVPIDLAVAHQTMAFVLAGSVMAYIADRTLLLR